VATRPARRNAAGRSFSSLLEHDLFRNRYPLFGIMPYPTISLPEKNCPISRLLNTNITLTTKLTR